MISDTPAWQALHDHFSDSIAKTHLRDLLNDEARCEALMLRWHGLVLDLSRQRVTQESMQLLLGLAEAAGLQSKIAAMFGGQPINATEGRAVMHTALRARRDQSLLVGGQDVVPGVWEVLDRIAAFSDKVRSGAWRGATGKPLTDVVAIGIGGSFLGPLFVHTALEQHPAAQANAQGRRLRFVANVDPADAAAALEGLDPATTLVVVVSKTFTTAETMINARAVRSWLVDALGPDAVRQHMVAVSTNLPAVQEFGIDPANAFGFWDWVGGRYSVCSAVGVLPLALQYGFPTVQEFLEGANSMDEHFRNEPLASNWPVLLGLLGLWNSSVLGCPARAILPYSQALSKLPAHIQQVDMESNGKGVAADGTRLPFSAGEIVFGEPGTNGQHSFYQLLHQGRVVPAEFIGVAVSQVQQPAQPGSSEVTSHDELMCNFFAQADALACGKSAEQLAAEGVALELVPHRTFDGNRPSFSLLLPEVSPRTVGQLLALYEHRVAVQGFLWGINSFDQWGVELGKVLALQVRGVLADARSAAASAASDGGDAAAGGAAKAAAARAAAGRGLRGPTAQLLAEYVHMQAQAQAAPNAQPVAAQQPGPGARM